MSKFWIASLAFLAIGLAGCITLNYALPDGICVLGNDSVLYLRSAANIQSGLGYVNGPPGGELRPVVHFPPLYPGCIAAANFVGGEIRQSTKLLHILTYGLSIACTGFVVYLGCHSLVLGALSSLLFLTSIAMFEIYTCALSETLFLALGTLGMTCFLIGLKKSSESLLLLSALLFGLTAATRYSGVVWIATATISLMLLTEGSWFRRLSRTIRFGSVAVLPFAAFVFRNHLYASAPEAQVKASYETVVFHPISTTHCLEGLNVVSRWFFPSRFVGWQTGLIVVVALCALVAIALWKGWKIRNGEMKAAGRVLLTLGLFILLYVGHLVLSISLLAFSTLLEDRILSPVLGSLIVLVPVLAAVIGRELPVSRMSRIAFVVGGVGFVLFGAVRTGAIASLIHEGGRGFFVKHWMTDPAILAIKALPQDALVYANEVGAIQGRLDRPVKEVPFKKDPYILRPNPGAATALEAMREELEKKSGILVYVFHGVNGEHQVVDRVVVRSEHEFTELELTEMLPLQQVLRSRHAAVYKLKGQ